MTTESTASATNTKRQRPPRPPRPPANRVAQTASTELPSMNIKHSSDLANRLYVLQADTSNTRLRVKSEMDGRQQRHDNARATAIENHEQKLREMDEAHDKSNSEFLEQLADIDRSLDIIKGGLDVADATKRAPAAPAVPAAPQSDA